MEAFGSSSYLMTVTKLGGVLKGTPLFLENFLAFFDLGFSLCRISKNRKRISVKKFLATGKRVCYNKEKETKTQETVSFLTTCQFRE